MFYNCWFRLVFFFGNYYLVCGLFVVWWNSYFGGLILGRMGVRGVVVIFVGDVRGVNYSVFLMVWVGVECVGGFVY